MVTVGINSKNPIIINTTINGAIHFAHFMYGIRATPKTPINTPEVGVIRFVKPSPN